MVPGGIQQGIAVVVVNINGRFCLKEAESQHVSWREVTKCGGIISSKLLQSPPR